MESSATSKSQSRSPPTEPSSKSNVDNEITISDVVIPDDLSSEKKRYYIEKSLCIIKNKKGQNQRYQQKKRLKESIIIADLCDNSTKRSPQCEKESLPLFDSVAAFGTEIHGILDIILLIG